MNFGNDPFVKKYQGIILNIVAKYSTDHDNYDDLVMAGMLGLYKAKATFNKNKKDFRKTASTKSCKMSSWIYNCARSEIQKAKNSCLGIKISPETARKKKPEVISYNERYDKTTDETAFTIIADSEDQLERIRLYNELWLHLNKKFSARDRNIVLDYFIHEKSVRWIDKKYGVSCYKVISQVKEYLQSIYFAGSSSSSTDTSVVV